MFDVFCLARLLANPSHWLHWNYLPIDSFTWPMFQHAPPTLFSSDGLWLKLTGSVGVAAQGIRFVAAFPSDPNLRGSAMSISQHSVVMTGDDWKSISKNQVHWDSRLRAALLSSFRESLSLRIFHEERLGADQLPPWVASATVKVESENLHEECRAQGTWLPNICFFRVFLRDSYRRFLK